MSKIINPGKPAFEIKETVHSSNSSYTHSIYLHGKLLSDELYVSNKGGWWYDWPVEEKELDIRLLSAIDAFEFPDNLPFHHFIEHEVHRFDLCFAERQAERFRFEFHFKTYDSEDAAAFLNETELIYWFAVLGIRDYDFNLQTFDGSHDLIIHVPIGKGDTFGDALNKASLMIEDIYTKAEAQAKKVRQDFLKQ